MANCLLAIGELAPSNIAMGLSWCALLGQALSGSWLPRAPDLSSLRPPFVRGAKYDAVDAEAYSRPSDHALCASEDDGSTGPPGIAPGRERLVCQRTALINQILRLASRIRDGFSQATSSALG